MVECSSCQQQGGLARVALLFLLAVAASVVLSGCSSAAEDPALAQRVESAIGSVGEAGTVREVSAESDGGVIVWLTLTKQDYGGTANARNAASLIANAVLGQVPEVTDVSVFDADNSIIDFYARE